jgi:hypothetical protein
MEATRENISQTFATNDADTHRILQNCNFGFFSAHFTSSEQAWREAHTHKNDVLFHKGVSIEFIKKHLSTFKDNQLKNHEPIWDHKFRGWRHDHSYQKVN